MLRGDECIKNCNVPTWSDDYDSETPVRKFTLNNVCISLCPNNTYYVDN